MYDLIGDIHGHADELYELLQALGYENRRGIFRHPERKVVFLGDFIDRGPKIGEVLQTVRSMVESGHALAVMGNHELNALAFHTNDLESPGQFLRRRNVRNVSQHSRTLEQLPPAELASHLDWFRTLPMWLELDEIRVVHACWDEDSMAKIVSASGDSAALTNAFLHSACRPGKELFMPVETLLKGKEAELPSGVIFRDKDGHVRTATRVRWYLSPERHTYRSYSLTDEIECDLEIDVVTMSQARPYPQDAKPVFVGHYWMSAARPEILAKNVACLDYSVAKGGFLCAYRWHGEKSLSNDHFIWTKPTGRRI